MGNCVIVNDEIAVDMGISFKKLKESGHIKDIRLVLLTHQHSDHFKASTVRMLHEQYPLVRFGCCDWMLNFIESAGVERQWIDVYKCGAKYDYGRFKVIAEEVPHDVRNCCYHIFFNEKTHDNIKKLFYCTDASSLSGIVAPNYDLYMVENNYTKDEIEQRIARKKEHEEYVYEYRAKRNHLDDEQVKRWLYNMASTKSMVVFLHKHKL